MHRQKDRRKRKSPEGELPTGNLVEIGPLRVRKVLSGALTMSEERKFLIYMHTSPSGIYQIKNTENGKVYVGSAVNIKQRWRTHKSDLNSSKHHSGKLQNAWNKYGESCFEFSILEYVQSKNDLVSREQEWMSNLNAAGENGYNISPTAGNCLGVKHSDETKKKHSLASKGVKQSEEWVRKRVESMSGQVMSEETKKKISAAHKGKKISDESIKKREQTRASRTYVISDETRRKKSEWQIGRKMPRDAVEKSAAKRRGRKLSDAHRKNLSDAHKGRILSDEHKNALSEAGKGRVFSDDHKKKLSIARKARVTSEETREKMSASHIARARAKKEAAQGDLRSEQHAVT